MDLQLHSNASDGALTPAALVEAASRASLVAIALTDHDTVAGIPAAKAAAERTGVRLVAGIELSAVEQSREVHLLGLHLSRLDEIERDLVRLREDRRSRAQHIVSRLNELGVPVTFDDVLREAQDGSIGRPHIARAMVRRGAVADTRAAFDRFLGSGRAAFVPKRALGVRESIALVHRGGGLAIWAHPGAEGTVERITAMRDAGLDGVEVLHPGHTPADVTRIGAAVEALDLVPSGGSDWHGVPDPRRTLGGMRVPLAWLERQDVRARERAARSRVA